MEDKLDKEWCIGIELVLDSLVGQYSDDEDLFYSTFPKLHAFKHIKSLATKGKPDLDVKSIDGELVDYAKEVYGYYTSHKKKLKDAKPAAGSMFTLRNSDDLAMFEIFLDKMLYLLELSPKHFIELFPKCPSVFWDKIDDLRETSFKYERDSDEYTRCLRKCKDLSFQFSELSGTNTSNYE